MAMKDNRDRIEQLTQLLRKLPTSEEKKILETCQFLYRLLYSHIHENLAVKKGNENEAEIRDLLRTVVQLELPLSEKQTNKFKQLLPKYKKMENDEGYKKCLFYVDQWARLHEGFFALAAFRSLKHWFLYYEKDFGDDKALWKYSLDPYNDGGKTGLINGYLYYANQAILDGNIKFIEKQMPSGTGKSYSDILTIGFIIGQDKENDVLKVFGNPSNLDDCGNYLKDLFMSKKFARVFPEYQKYHDMDGELESNLFKVCKISKEVTITLADSTKTNVRVVAKEKKISGVRARFLFIDDITQQEDTEKIKVHQKDWDTFWGVWFKRRYSDGKIIIFASGTTYHYADILSRLKAYFSDGKLYRCGFNKFTFVNENKDAAFIVVPRIDEDTGETTLPQKFTTKDSLEIKKRNEREFYAMEQQKPLPPETSPFYMDKLQTYDVIPEEGRSEYCWASLDSARVGNDYNAMPIFTKVGDKFYLKDVLYLREPMDKVYQPIIDKIKFHKITKLVIEKNIDTSLKALLTKMLVEQGILWCEIIEVYATVKKEEKIYNMETTIKNCCVFPADHLFYISSQMGKFMNDIYYFSYQEKNEHDDSIDAVATFCQRLIVSANRGNKVKILKV